MVTLHGIEVKVGDKVWDFRDGWAEVISIANTSLYKILTTGRSYTSDGKVHSEDKFPILFWNEFEVPEEAFIKPLPKLAVDTKVLVWDCDDALKERRYFSHFDDESKIYCFNSGATSWGAQNTKTKSWRNWELYEEGN